MVSFEIHKQNEIRKQEIEVRALVALLHCDDENVREDAMLKLCNFAFPEILADKINNLENKK